MPTYEYICTKCGHEFEQFQSMTDKPLTKCPIDKCAKKSGGRGTVKRKMSGGAGLIFKGSGFYITDYRSEGYKAAAKNDTSSSAPASGGGETKPPAKTESKPAAKEKPKSSKPKKD